jgi:uncharacterized protein (DUF305 family)
VRGSGIPCRPFAYNRALRGPGLPPRNPGPPSGPLSEIPPKPPSDPASPMSLSASRPPEGSRPGSLPSVTAVAPVFLALALALAWAPDLVAQEPPRIVQPGAPGEAGRVVLPGSEAFRFPAHVEADVHFMQMMIGHHAQALEMAALASERSAREDVKLLAHRIHLAQFDEIGLMARWLRDRGERIPEEARVAGIDPGGDDHADHAVDPHAGHPASHHGAHHGADHADPHEPHDMPGMLTPEQLAELAAASGEAFDRLFLEFMIFHHEGAILMVRELFASDAGGQEGEVYQFAAHVDSDQRIEIERMRQMLATAATPQQGPA